MNAPLDTQTEQERIRTVYRQWHGGAALARYAWHRPDVVQQAAARARNTAALLAATVGTDLSLARILDVGCGNGAFLRQLIDWGADPYKLMGTEFQQDRLDCARIRTATGVHWHFGDLRSVSSASVDLAVAQTVFSSVLDESARAALAAEMWRTVKPGGWCMMFDFRYNNPRNPNVRKVTRAELAQFWPARQRHYRTLLLAPPLARRMAGLPHVASELLAGLVPALRSHFIYMARKGA